MPSDTTGRKQLISYLEDMYALEAHLVQVLDDHVKDAKDVPQVRQKIEQHLRETEMHRDRLEQRLHALGTGKPGVKSGFSHVLGQVIGSVAGTRSDTLAKNARDEYASEQLEIASYLELITVAQAVGDLETVRVAELNLRDEMVMQQWLLQHTPEVVLMCLQQDGIQVDQNALLNTQSIFSNLGIGGFGTQPQQQYGTQPPYPAGQQPYQTPPTPGVV
jgi:ferritin-like metal-binding protein YciE